jgi:hypothetical protein
MSDTAIQPASKPITTQHKLMRIGGLLTLLMGTNAIDATDVAAKSHGLISESQMDLIMLGKDLELSVAQMDYLAQSFKLNLDINFTVPAGTALPVT